MRSGSLAGWEWPVELYTWQRGDKPRFSLWINTVQWESIVINDEDADLLDRYVHVQYAPTRWESGEPELREMNDRAKGTGA